MTRTRRMAAVLAVGVLLAGQGVLSEPSAPPAKRRDKSLLLEAQAGVNRALKYLASAQQEDGSWKGDPAITGLIVTALAGSGQEGFGPQDQPISQALAYIRKFAKGDGSIHGGFYQSYTTSICVMALIETGQEQDKELIRRAQAFLLGLQADEDEGFSADDGQYGGWGYEKDAEGDGMHRPDMSNTQIALEAVWALQEVMEEDTPAAGGGETGDRSGTELAFDKALRYLERCQNQDGGFIYRPDESKAGADEPGALRSYASMTYAGLKSMIYARLDRDDPRVRAAYGWASRHWSVTENPGMGSQGLFYNYHTMARALDVYGEEMIIDADGKAHDWRAELTGQLLKVQREDGSWVNIHGRWMETIPELVTAYSVLAIEHATARW